MCDSLVNGEKFHAVFEFAFTEGSPAFVPLGAGLLKMYFWFPK